jgi:glycosyltransferase involved in cell wall biosynthesis
MTVVTTSLRPKIKRLLTVGHSYVHRSNRQLAEAMQEASNGGWEVTVAAPAFYEGNPRFGDLKPEFLKVGADEKVDVVGIPVRFSGRVHFALYGTRLRALMASGFDAVHCWEEPYMLASMQMAQWAPRDAIVTFLTWQNIRKSYPPPFSWLERKVLARADGWVAGATLVERALQDRPVYRDRPHRIIGFGIDPAVYRPDPAARSRVRSSLGWGQDEGEGPVVGFVGRFTEAKGLPVLLRALSSLEGAWRALFVGSGPLDAELRRWSARFGSRVKIVPVIPHEDVPKYLNAMDLLCVPSQTTPIWREQFGRVLIEAFACGVCVIASNSGEIPYVVADAGKVIDERDEEGWRREIEALLGNQVLRQRFATRGRARAEEHYTWSAVGAKSVAFLEDIERTKRVRSYVKR